MKKVSKKLLSFLFVLTLLIGTSTTAFANSYSTMSSGSSDSGGGTSCAHYYVPVTGTECVLIGTPAQKCFPKLIGHKCEFCGAWK